MLRRLFLCYMLLVVSAAVASVPPHAVTPGELLARRLRNLEGVKQTEVISCGKFDARVELMVEQLLDPKDSTAGTLLQRVLVMHVGADRPTVLITQGYDAAFGLREGYRDELSVLFDANIVLVEHRYFGRSVPDSLDWKHLTAENSAYDLHRIRRLFAPVYPGKWIASGISKGGTTTMLYATFFPRDVDIYVPYVGPLCRSVEDRRFNAFMRRVGTPAARDSVKAFQQELLRRREGLLPAFVDSCAVRKCSFRVPLEEIYDYCVLEYSIAFWQMGYSTERIPSCEATDGELLGALLRDAGPEYFSVESPISPFFVQAARELGYYPYDLRPLRKYMAIRSTKSYLHRIFLPAELQHEKFSKELYRKMSKYLKNNDVRMMMVYGANDPWTAPGAGWTVRGKRNMECYVVPEGSHRSRIADLPDAERAEAIDKLRKWLED